MEDWVYILRRYCELCRALEESPSSLIISFVSLSHLSALIQRLRIISLDRAAVWASWIGVSEHVLYVPMPKEYGRTPNPCPNSNAFFLSHYHA